MVETTKAGDSSKKQLGPRIDKALAEAFKWFVKYVNDGLYKGRLADEVERAVQLRMGLHFLGHKHELYNNDELYNNVIREYQPVIEECVSNTEDYILPLVGQILDDTESGSSVGHHSTYQRSSDVRGRVPVMVAEDLLSVGSRNKKMQLGPRIDKSLGDAFEWFVKYANDGQYKGRLAEEIERAIQLRMGLYFLRHLDELQKVSREHAPIIEQCVSNGRKYLNEVIGPDLPEHRRARERRPQRDPSPDRRQPIGVEDSPRRTSLNAPRNERQGTTPADARPQFDSSRRSRDTRSSVSDEIKTTDRDAGMDDISSIEDISDSDKEKIEAALDTSLDENDWEMIKIVMKDDIEIDHGEISNNVNSTEETEKADRGPEASDSEEPRDAGGDGESEFSFANINDETGGAGTP